MALVLFGMFACARATSQGTVQEAFEEIRLQFKWTHQYQFAGVYATIEQGYYDDAGLEVTLIEGGPTHSPIDEVLDGNADSGIGDSTILLRRLNGAPIVAVAAILQHSPYSLIVLEDPGFHSPGDLAGKSIVVSGSERAEYRVMLSNAGVDLESVAWVPLEDNCVDALVSGRIDSLAVYMPEESYYLLEENVKFNAIRPLAYGVDFYGDCLFTAVEEYQTNPDRVEAFRGATLRGWAYTVNHVDEMIDLIHSRYGSQKTWEALQYEAQIFRELMVPDLVEIGYMNAVRWEHIANAYRDQGLAPVDSEYEGFIWNHGSSSGPNWIATVVIVDMISTGLLICILALLYFVKLERHLGYWAIAFTVLLAYNIVMAAHFVQPLPFEVSLLEYTIPSLSVLFLYWGIEQLVYGRILKRWLFAPPIIVLWVAIADWFGLPFAVAAFPPYFFVGFVFILSGAQIIRMPTISGVEKNMVGWGMILWGIHNLDFPFLRDNASFAPYGITIASVLKTFTAFAMTILSIRRELAAGLTSRLRFDKIFDNSLDAILITHPDTYRILDANASACTLLGYDRGELISIPPHELTPVSADQLREFVQEFVDSEGWSGGLKFVHKNGTFIHTETSISRIDRNDAPNFILSIHDITHRKEREEELERAKKAAEESSAQVKTLSGLLPICSGCKKNRDDDGNWNQIESYVAKRTDADFSHGICPECKPKYFPDL